jgi:hypothetical protein
LKGGAVTTGRALHVMAQEGIANCKKALSFVKQLLDKNGNLLLIILYNKVILFCRDQGCLSACHRLPLYMSRLSLVEINL